MKKKIHKKKESLENGQKFFKVRNCPDLVRLSSFPDSFHCFLKAFDQGFFPLDFFNFSFGKKKSKKIVQKKFPSQKKKYDKKFFD